MVPRDCALCLATLVDDLVFMRHVLGSFYVGKIWRYFRTLSARDWWSPPYG